jgi:hypothetical protein
MTVSGTVTVLRRSRWPEAVQHGKADDHQDHQDRPSRNAEEGVGNILKAEMGEHYRQNHDGAYGEKQRAMPPR